jgi:hypothetical protein
MRTPPVRESLPTDDVPNLGESGTRSQHEVALTLEEAIERARKLVAHYEIGRVIVRDATGGRRRVLPRGGPAAASTRRPSTRRRAP